jgi:hypothetical protein
VIAPTPSASVMTTVAANPGLDVSVRTGDYGDEGAIKEIKKSVSLITNPSP